jgi:hypothetical protein
VREQFRFRIGYRLLMSFAVVVGLGLAPLPSARAGFIVLASGTGGSLVSGQTYNETRGVDVTVLTSSDLLVTSMRLDDLSIGSAASALVGARIYDSSTNLLITSANTVITSSGSVFLPISATLTSGDSFRLAFYVETTPLFQGSGVFFDPDPAGLGGFPYIESQGILRINSAHSINTDSFPSNANIFVPQITVEATLLDAVPAPSSLVLLGLGAIALAAYGWRYQKPSTTEVAGSIVMVAPGAMPTALGEGVQGFKRA